MAIVKCKECGNEVSTKASACPKCGAVMFQPKTSGCAWAVIVVFFLIVALLYSIGKSVTGVATKYRATTSTSSAEPDYQLELLSFNCADNGIGTTVVNGQVRNISAGKIDAVWAIAEFYDKSGGLIASDSSVAEIHPLLPGQTTPFKVYGPTNPAVKSCSVAGFRHTFAGQIAWRKAAKK